MMRHIGIVFNKEVMDNLRDRRSISSTLTSALVSPLMLVVMIVLLGQMFNSNPDEKPLRVPLAGVENAPVLVEFLKQNAVTVLSAPADPEAAVRNGDFDVVLIIPEGFGEDFSSARPATVKLVLDTSRTSATMTIERVNALLDGYSRQIGSQRLLVRGVSPEITNVLSIERVDVSTPQSRTMIFLYMLPFLLIMTIFLGGMYVIIDATAGERERGSLEPLLINPVRRIEMVLGKQLASLPFAVATMILTLVVFGLTFNLVPIEQFLGMPMSLNTNTLWEIFWLSIPMLLLASAVQMVLAGFTRSFKEAQTYLSFVPLIAGLPSMFAGFMAIKPSFEAMLVPTFGQALLINQLVRGESMDLNLVLISSGVTLLVAVLLTGVAIRLYQRETILFGKK